MTSKIRCTINRPGYLGHGNTYDAEIVEMEMGMIQGRFAEVWREWGASPLNGKMSIACAVCDDPAIGKFAVPMVFVRVGEAAV